MIENKQAKNKDVQMVIYYLEVDFLWKFFVQPKIVTKKTEFTAKTKLERLQFSTSSSFVKI